MKFLHDSCPEKYPLESSNATVTMTGFSKTNEFSSSTGKMPKLETVMTKIKNIVKAKSIRIEEFFLDHDTLRKGDVSAAKFESCLDGLK